MVKRIVLAGLVGGLAMFLWLAAGHMSPLGRIGIDALPREVILSETMVSAAGDKSGLFVFPADPAAPPAVPSGFLVFYPDNVMTMTAAEPLAELIKDIVQAMLLAALMAQIASPGFFRRLGFAAGAGAMVALTTHGSYFIWYHFPRDFTVADGAMTFGAYVVAGAVIAPLLGRAPQRMNEPATA
jgi:hypothetical protein